MTYDPQDPRREGIDEEDARALGMEDPDELNDVASTESMMESADSAQPYMAPTDPPVIPGGRDGIEVADGFALTDEGAEERDGTPGDDAITQRVKRLLQLDAATSTLRLAARTVDGVVYLRGVVPSLDDTDLAAEVASRVPGVVEVVDEMTVE